MTTVIAEILEVVVGTEPPQTHSLALYAHNGVLMAMFVTQQTDLRWQPSAVPDYFLHNPACFEEFTADLADCGYILETKHETRQ